MTMDAASAGGGRRVDAPSTSGGGPRAVTRLTASNPLAGVSTAGRVGMKTSSGHPRCLEFPVTDNNKIINQLRALVLLTQTEEQVARTRVAQARTDAVRRELT